MVVNRQPGALRGLTPPGVAGRPASLIAAPPRSNLDKESAIDAATGHPFPIRPACPDRIQGTRAKQAILGTGLIPEG